MFWISEEGQKGDAERSEVVVCQSVLMLLDSLFPVSVRYWVYVGIGAVVLAAAHSSPLCSSHCFSLRKINTGQVVHRATFVCMHSFKELYVALEWSVSNYCEANGNS